MFKFCMFALLLSTSTYSLANDPGPTFPLVKDVQNLEESRRHIGLIMGINNSEGSRGATPELGIDIGFQPLIPFGLGLELSTSRFDGADDELNKRTTLMGRGTYNFGGDTPVVRYSFIGLATGAVFLHDGTEMGIAPLMGFDVPLNDDHSYSLGFIAKYLFVTSHDPDALITAATIKHGF